VESIRYQEHKNRFDIFEAHPIPTGLRVERWQELLPWVSAWEMLPTSWQNFLNLKKRLSKTSPTARPTAKTPTSGTTPD